MSKHSIVEMPGSDGWQVWTDAVCSCGWRATRLWGFNNPKWRDFEREKAQHVADNFADLFEPEATHG
jgi:hypothetical protein